METDSTLLDLGEHVNRKRLTQKDNLLLGKVRSFERRVFGINASKVSEECEHLKNKILLNLEQKKESSKLYNK